MSEDLERETIDGEPENEEKIRERAYYLYVERGYASGYDVEDWLQAETELADPG